MSKAQEILIARRYAKAFYDLAEERGKTDTVAKDIKSLRDMPKDEHFTHFLKNPLVKREEQANVMRALAAKGKLDGLTANFLGVIALNGRLALLPQILEAAGNEIAARRGEISAEVTSARPLSATQAAKLADSLKKITGTDVDMVLKQDESILGGLKIKLGSTLIDQSVKTRLDKLERTLKSGGRTEDRANMRNAA